MPVGTVHGMSGEDRSGKKDATDSGAQDSQEQKGRFSQRPRPDGTGPEESRAPIPTPSNPNTKGFEERPRSDAAASAHILRRLMPKPYSTLEAEADGAAIARAETGKRILLADDDPMMRNSIRLTLEQAGYSVMVADSGETAWQIFSKSPSSFDLLITDISMPALDGASLAHRVRLLRPHLRIILISGYFDEKATGGLVKEGRAEFLAKPFGLDTLMDKVRGPLKNR